MTGPGQLATMSAGAFAVASSGPLLDVFNELAFVMAVVGALGGLTRGLAIRTPWRSVLRSVSLGALLAFGFGAVAPTVVANLFSIQIGGGNSVQILAASAYFLGFGQDLVIARFSTGEKKDG